MGSRYLADVIRSFDTLRTATVNLTEARKRRTLKIRAYTTFSTFSLDSILLWERGQYGWAAAYIIVSVAASLAGVLLGAMLVRVLNEGALI